MLRKASIILLLILVFGLGIFLLSSGYQILFSENQIEINGLYYCDNAGHIISAFDVEEIDHITIERGSDLGICGEIRSEETIPLIISWTHKDSEKALESETIWINEGQFRSMFIQNEMQLEFQSGLYTLIIEAHHKTLVLKDFFLDT